MGGRSQPQVIEAPAPPRGQTLGEAFREYQGISPEMYALQEKYGPLYGALEKQINEKLYPNTSALQEALAAQSLQGINEGLPADLRQQYVSDFNAGLGTNVNAPIGVSDRNVALTQLNKQWGDYYRNLGLSLAGRQPLATGGDTSSGFGQALSFEGNRFANQVGAYGQSLANRIVSPRGGFNVGGAAMGGGTLGLLSLSNPATAPFALGFGALGAAGGGL